ncbi:MAG: PAS domain-containing protein [Solidesulfovibrio sp.]|uniref:PAS domain-containing protein n=1 Tax=Solidesulfovibrio sp. TaxID=2910990 RepID=UPI002B21B3EE|nr:PAS domain-containing protein [Solidesulfovibrio sp.]
MIQINDLATYDSVTRRDLSREELHSLVESFPALLWRIEIIRSRIEYLNRSMIAGLNEKTTLFLKSAEIRKNVVFKEDAILLDSFMEAVKRGKNAQTIVRIHGTGQETAWLKLVGWMPSKDVRYYMGYLMDVTDRIEVLKGMIERETEMQLMIELSDMPVVLVDLDTKMVLSQNAAALQLFMYSPDEFRGLRISDLFHHGMASVMHSLYEEILFARKWRGKALFERKAKSVFSAEASVLSLLFKDRRILRIALSNIEAASPVDSLAALSPATEPQNDLRAQRESELLKALEGQTELPAILETLFDCQLPHGSFDAILFSDIQAKKNRVFVYSFGEPFASMTQGEMYAYEGTIAQDIERFKLDSLIVDDTIDSIKSIDWALFIPKGIRSYFAKPFYQRGVLKAVMILCSLRPNAFHSDGMAEYAILFEPFRRAIQAWRTAHQARRAPRNA